MEGRTPPGAGTTLRRARGRPFTPHSSSEIQRTLKEDDLRLIALAKAVLEDPDVPAQLEDQLDRLRVDGIKAEGESRYATLRREVAELALKEYVEAILPHDLIAAEAALAAAKADQAKARADPRMPSGTWRRSRRSLR